MKKLIAGATVIACMMMGSAAFAKDHDKGNGKGRERVEGRWDRDRDRGGEHRDVRWDRDHDRDHRPPGWDKGKKKGWGDCDVPPGQAKKQGCYDHHRRYRPTHRVERRRPPTVHRTQRPVVGVWQRNKQTTSTTTTTTPNTGTWRRPTTTQQTTTTTTTQPAPTQPGVWRK